MTTPLSNAALDEILKTAESSSEDDRAVVAILHELLERRKLLEELRPLFCDLAQLLDGWHNDGTAWSEWDESVRKRLSQAQAVIETTLAATEPHPLPPGPTEDATS